MAGGEEGQGEQSEWASTRAGSAFSCVRVEFPLLHVQGTAEHNSRSLIWVAYLSHLGRLPLVTFRCEVPACPAPRPSYTHATLCSPAPAVSG